MTYKSTYLSDD